MINVNSNEFELNTCLVLTRHLFSFLACRACCSARGGVLVRASFTLFAHAVSTILLKIDAIALYSFD